MFGHRYFGARYFAPRYFGDGGDLAPPPPTFLLGAVSIYPAVDGRPDAYPAVSGRPRFNRGH